MAVSEVRPADLSACELLEEFQAGTLSAEEVVRDCLSRITDFDADLRAWAFVDPSHAISAAARIDRARKDSRSVGTLGGVPIGIKDIFNTYDMPTSMGSPVWKGFTPGNDARVVSELRLNGGVILGKTVTAEFAVHTPGETRNPHNRDYMPGTSSSGSAAAVAARMVPVSLGTQTAGSTIRPASYCGVFGFKPSFGLVPRTGCLKTTDSLDTVGWFARCVDDIALLFDVLRVRGADYPMIGRRLEDPSGARPKGSQWKVAVAGGPKWECAEGYARAALSAIPERLTAAGIEVVDAPLPASLDTAHDVHAVIYDNALSYYFREEFQHDQLISPIMKELVSHGQTISPLEYRAALDAQRRISSDIDQWFADSCDLMLTLSTGGEALPGLTSVDRPDSCLVWTLAGLPCLNLPMFTGPAGLPFGLQVVGRRYHDHAVLSFGRFLEAQLCAPIACPIPTLPARV